MIGCFLFFVVGRVQRSLARNASRGPPKRGGMRAREGVDDFRKRAQVKMEQTTDSVVVIEPVSFGGKARRSMPGIQTAR